MPFCRECGADTPEDELRLYSGHCRACYQSQSENNNEKSLYPRFYPRELKHLNRDKSSPRNQHGSIETTPVPSIEEIKRLSKYKRNINIGIKQWFLIIIIILVSLPFLFPFYFNYTIANSLAIDYSHALINTYAVVALYTNLIYYGIIGLCFLIGGFAGLIQEDSDLILPVGICFSIILIIIGVIFGNIIWGNLAPELFAYLKS
jgi:hypothetical protein